MQALGEPVRANTLFLLTAGIIMVSTLWISKKARGVSRTEVSLGRQVDGYERTPAILLTGRAEELNIKKLRDEMFVSVLSKPCNIVKLVETVTEILEDAFCVS